jgi:hypothetical protein
MVAAVLSAYLLVIPTICWGEPSDKPFSPGEKLTFQLKWGFIPAGEATLEILPLETMNNQPVHHFVMTVRTNAFLDLFYFYRSRIDAYAAIDMAHSVRYRERTRTRIKATEVVVDFDWSTRQAHYRSTETIHQSPPKTNRKKHITQLLPGTFDPLSVYYYTRLLNIELGDRIERPITDGLKCVVARAEVLQKESLTINGQTYSTFLIQPDFKGVKPVFEKLVGATIRVWITADEDRIPVKLSSRIVLGSFTGELTSNKGNQSKTY